jgi:hypothetical protein
MDLSNLRAENTDNGKHDPVGTRSKAEASAPAFWPTSMGAWDAPGRVMLPPEREGDEDGDDSYISEQGVGTQAYNPDPQYKSSDFNSRKA